MLSSEKVVHGLTKESVEDVISVVVVVVFVVVVVVVSFELSMTESEDEIVDLLFTSEQR